MIEKISAIEKKTFPDGWSHNQLSSELAKDFSVVLLSMDDKNDVSGYIIGWHLLDEFHILRLAVLEERRGEGIGKALLKRLAEFSVGKDIRRILLEVSSKNIPAINIYEGFGFVLNGKRKDYYGKDIDGLNMELKLK